MSLTLLAADAIAPTTEVLGIPWGVWLTLGGAVIGALTWFGRLLVVALNNAREDAKTSRTELVNLINDVRQDGKDSRAELAAIINRSNEVHVSHTVAIEKLTAYIERIKD